MSYNRQIFLIKCHLIAKYLSTRCHVIKCHLVKRHSTKRRSIDDERRKNDVKTTQKRRKNDAKTTQKVTQKRRLPWTTTPSDLTHSKFPLMLTKLKVWQDSAKQTDVSFKSGGQWPWGRTESRMILLSRVFVPTESHSTFLESSLIVSSGLFYKHFTMVSYCHLLPAKSFWCSMKRWQVKMTHYK